MKRVGGKDINRINNTSYCNKTKPKFSASKSNKCVFIVYTKSNVSIVDRQVIFLVIMHDSGSFQLVNSPSSKSSYCYYFRPEDQKREGLCVNFFYGLGLKVMDIISAYNQLTGTQEIDYI